VRPRAHRGQRDGPISTVVAQGESEMPNNRYQALAFAIACLVVGKALVVLVRLLTGAGQ